MSSPIEKRLQLQLNAFAIFQILEQQRNLKLRELYHNKRVHDALLLPTITEESCSASSISMSTTTSTTTTSVTKKSSLRQLKKKKNATSSNCMSTLPKFPPRYAALSEIITSDVLMVHLRTTSSTHTSTCHNQLPSSPPSKHSSQSFYLKNEYKNIDQTTKRFLNDTVQILQDRCNEEAENNETKLEIMMRRRGNIKTSRRLLEFRVEKKLSLIVD